MSIRNLQALEFEKALCQDTACQSDLEHRIVQGLESLAYHYRTHGLRLRAIRQYVKYMQRGGMVQLGMRGIMAAIVKSAKKVNAGQVGIS